MTAKRKGASDLDALIAAAREVQQRAYAPYSHFLVGAALRGRSGKIYTGCNFENSSYGLSLCAERAAVARAISDGEAEFVELAVITKASPPGPPCGACRQVLAEFAPELEVVLIGGRGEIERTRLADLLPRAFDKTFL